MVADIVKRKVIKVSEHHQGQLALVQDNIPVAYDMSITISWFPLQIKSKRGSNFVNAKGYHSRFYVL